MICSTTSRRTLHLRHDFGRTVRPSRRRYGWARQPRRAPHEQLIKVAIIGRPNVGKSTLLNSLLDEERSIVSPLPGTTRDAVDAELECGGLRFRFIDTAGIRAKGKTKLLAEKLSVIQARKHLERADVALLIFDGPEGVTALDAHIGGYAHESRRSVVIVVNKWDLSKKGRPPRTIISSDTAANEIPRLRTHRLHLRPAWSEIGNLLKTVAEVAEIRRRRVSTSEMNQFLKEVDFERAPTPAGKPTRIYYLTQGGVCAAGVRRLH